MPNQLTRPFHATHHSFELAQRRITHGEPALPGGRAGGANNVKRNRQGLSESFSRAIMPA